MNIAIIDDVQQDLDALAEAAREHYDQKQISIQLHTFSSPEDFWNSYSPGSYDLIYLILAAQFESFKDPLIIMLTVPLAIAGARRGLKRRFEGNHLVKQALV